MDKRSLSADAEDTPPAAKRPKTDERRNNQEKGKIRLAAQAATLKKIEVHLQSNNVVYKSSNAGIKKVAVEYLKGMIERQRELLEEARVGDFDIKEDLVLGEEEWGGDAWFGWEKEACEKRISEYVPGKMDEVAMRRKHEDQKGEAELFDLVMEA